MLTPGCIGRLKSETTGYLTSLDTDPQTCLKLLNTDDPVPYGPSDFADATQWANYRAAEVSTLSQMMLLMMQTNPSLVQTSDRQSNGDLSSRVDSLKLDAPPASFTYIPLDPRATYKDLLSRCLEWDLEILSTLPEDEDVSLGVLSQEHISLLGECAVRWRLPPSFRAWVFLEAIVERFEQGNVPAACVHEATAMVGKVSAEAPVDTWAIPDVSEAQRDGVMPANLSNKVSRPHSHDEMLASSPPWTSHCPTAQAAITRLTSSKLCLISWSLASKIRATRNWRVWQRVSFPAYGIRPLKAMSMRQARNWSSKGVVTRLLQRPWPHGSRKRPRS